MTRKTHRFLTGPLMPLAAFAVSFVLSLVLFFIFRPPMEGRVFFFPDNSGRRIGSERRGIPARKEISGEISVFLEELALGPVTLEWDRTLPRSTDVRHVAVSGKTAYVDLGQRMLKADAELPVSFDQALNIVRRNILFNFPRIEDVVFTIDGSQVHAPYYAGPDETD